MKCAICKKTSDEVPLYSGILEANMVMVCDECAENEGIPVIKKPSESQLDKANERYSVRERMERMSGMRDATEISDDQIVTQGNLAKLRTPPKKESHEDVLDNYYWTLNIARRRAKMSVGQLAEKMCVSPDLIQSIEKGKIPQNFEEVFIKLEAFLGIKLLKAHKRKVNFVRMIDKEKEILEEVRRKMGHPDSKEDTELKEEQINRISKGEANFSKRENLSNVTLNDLVEMKKERETREQEDKIMARKAAMIGDDLDLDIDEL